MSILDRLAAGEVNPNGNPPRENSEPVQEVQQEQPVQEVQEPVQEPVQQAVETQTTQESYQQEQPVSEESQPGVTEEASVENQATPTENTDTTQEQSEYKWLSDQTDTSDSEEPWAAPMGDTGFTQPATDSNAEIDFSSLNSVFGKEVKSIEDITNAVTELQNQTQEVFANDQLRQANEIALMGGDPVAFLQGSVNTYSHLDTDELLMQQMKAQMGNMWDDERIRDYIEDMDPNQKDLQAQSIRNNFMQQDQQQRIAYENQVKAQRQAHENTLASMLTSVNEIAGRKLSNADKTASFNALRQPDNWVKEMFYSNGVFNAAKAVELDFIARNYKQLLTQTTTQTRNETIGQILEETQNVNIPNRKTAGTPQPNHPSTPQQSNLQRALAGEEKLKVRRTGSRR
jgi:hypothetical protein